MRKEEREERKLLPFEKPPIPDRLSLSYHVSRSSQNNLPVYTDFKAHGTLMQTMVRKIDGSSKELMNDLVRHLNLDPKDCKVAMPTGHVVLRGAHRARVENFLRAVGF